MTTGSPFWTVLRFSVPLMIGDFCQQLYNTVDSIIVGRVVGKGALAALGVAGPIMSIVLFLLVGVAMGVGVVISQHFGAGRYERLRRAAATGLAIGIVCSLAIAAISIGLSRPFLAWMRTPESILDSTDLYLKIVFAGAIFTYLYNFYCFGIRAIGNAFAPLMFLLVSVGLNAVLDVLFVAAFGMGVAGAAIATVVAQLVSAAMCIVYTHLRVPMLGLRLRDLRIDRKELPAVLSYGSSMALQKVFIYVGRIAVQGLVNRYDVNVIAGVNSATRLDALIQTPIRGYTNALTTYCAQNYGARRFDRIRRGYRASWIGVVAYTVVSMTLGILCSEPLVRLFVDADETQVVRVGADFVIAMASGYLFMCVIVQSQAYMKGVGLLKSFFGSTATAIAFRIGLSYLFEHFWGLRGMYWAVPASWLVGALYGMTVVALSWRRRCAPRVDADVCTDADCDDSDS